MWAGHVRVRDAPRLNATIVGQRDYGTIVRGSVVVQGEDRKDSRWLKLADGSGYMLIEENEEDEEEEDEKVEEKEEEKTEERKKISLLLGPLPDSQLSWDRLRLQPSFVSQRPEDEERDIQDAQTVMAFTGRDLELCLIALKEDGEPIEDHPRNVIRWVVFKLQLIGSIKSTIHTYVRHVIVLLEMLWSGHYPRHESKLVDRSVLDSKSNPRRSHGKWVNGSDSIARTRAMRILRRNVRSDVTVFPKK